MDKKNRLKQEMLKAKAILGIQEYQRIRERVDQMDIDTALKYVSAINAERYRNTAGNDIFSKMIKMIPEGEIVALQLSQIGSIHYLKKKGNWFETFRDDDYDPLVVQQAISARVNKDGEIEFVVHKNTISRVFNNKAIKAKYLLAINGFVIATKNKNLDEIDEHIRAYAALYDGASIMEGEDTSVYTMFKEDTKINIMIAEDLEIIARRAKQAKQESDDNNK